MNAAYGQTSKEVVITCVTFDHIYVFQFRDPMKLRIPLDVGAKFLNRRTEKASWTYFGSFFSWHKLRQEMLKPMKKMGEKKPKNNCDVSEFLEHLQIFSLCQDLVIGRTIYMHQNFLKIFP